MILILAFYPPGDKTGQLAYEQLQRILSPYSAVVLISSDQPIPTTISHPEVTATPEPNTVDLGADKATDKGSASCTPKAKRIFPEEAVADFLRLVHCNPHGKAALVGEFLAFWKDKVAKEEALDQELAEVSKKKVFNKLNEVAEYKRCKDPKVNRKCYVVKQEVLEKYDLVDKLEVPNAWLYITEMPKLTTAAATVGKSPTVSSGEAKDSVGDGATPKAKQGDIIRFFTPKAAVDRTPGAASGEKSATPSTPETPKSAGPPKEKAKKRASILTLFGKATENAKKKKSEDGDEDVVCLDTDDDGGKKEEAKSSEDKSSEAKSSGAKSSEANPSKARDQSATDDKSKKPEEEKKKPEKKRVALITLQKGER